jgi:hypothetical protein
MRLEEMYRQAQSRARRTPSARLRRIEREIVAKARLAHPGDRDLARLAAARNELRQRDQSRSGSRWRVAWRWRFWRFAP